MSWFRSGPSQHQTPLAMIGAKAGDQALVVGANRPDLAAALALITGLNGRTVVAGDAASQTAVEVAAAAAGALVEFVAAAPSHVPVEPATFDVVVVMTPLTAREAALRHSDLVEALRTLRAGGRVILVESPIRAGLFRRPRTGLDADALQSLLKSAGAGAVRLLSEADGFVFVEGRRPQSGLASPGQ